MTNCIPNANKYHSVVNKYPLTGAEAHLKVVSKFIKRALNTTTTKIVDAVLDAGLTTNHIQSRRSARVYIDASFLIFPIVFDLLIARSNGQR